MSGVATPPSDVDLLLEELGRRLPGPLGFDGTPGAPPPAPSHPLALELAALRAGHAASLPYPTRAKVAWFTLASSHDGLRRAIADLRAWLIPSLAWEAPHAPVVLPGATTGPLGTRIAAVSPGGYYRWYTTHAGLDPVLARLRQMRHLESRRPFHVAAARPGLFELRHRFQVALAVGDREAAVDALSIVDADRLDSAVNTGFMRLRLAAHFADHAAVIDDPGLPFLLQMRLPSRVREAVLTAHHQHLLRPLEDASNVAGALMRYEAVLHDLLSGQIVAAVAAAAVRSGPSEVDAALTRLIAYRHAANGDVAALAAAAAFAPDDQVVANLRALLSPAAPEPGSESTIPVAPAAPIPVAPAAPVRTASSTPVDAIGVSLGWSNLPEAFRERRWPAVDLFIAHATGAAMPNALDPPASVDDGSVVADALFELAAAPDLLDSPGAGERFDGVLLAVVNGSEPALPRPEHRAVYAALLPIWSERRRRSSYPPDGDLMLVLAEAVLTFDGPNRADEAVGALRAWWEAYPVRARLPWLLAALELLSELGPTAGAAQSAATSLWVDGAELIRRDAAGISRGERALWRRIGARLGFEAASVTEYLGAPDLPTGEDGPDPLRDLPAERVAIVTLQERAAKAARDLLAHRISAEIQVVSVHVAGPATDAAKAADVILFASGANKHAVFVAFDGVRDRIEYVAGKGASSIVTALERWANRARAGSPA